MYLVKTIIHTDSDGYEAYAGIYVTREDARQAIVEAAKKNLYLTKHGKSAFVAVGIEEDDAK